MCRPRRLAVETHVGKKLGTSIEEAAAAIVSVSTENMVQAIADITVNQGIDPAEAALIGGGGAAGLNTIFIARRLGMRIIVYPEVGAALSAAGALMSELSADNRATAYTATSAFDKKLANKSARRAEAEGSKPFSSKVALGPLTRASTTRVEAPLRASGMGNRRATTHG